MRTIDRSRLRPALRALVLGTVAALLVLALPGSTLAARFAPGFCSGGTIPAGTYHGFIVTGQCTVAAGATVRILGDLTITRGAALDDHAVPASAEVHITGDVRVGHGAILGLGYDAAPGSLGKDTVGGSIVAFEPRTLYLGNVWVGGSVISIGGGLAGTSAADFRNLPLKDNVIRGNLVVAGWRGGWMGLIRNQVRGSVFVLGNVSASSDTGPGMDTDSTEVQTNAIGGNLVCFGNGPAAQINPVDGGLPNAVGGHALGECAGLTQ